MKRLDNEEWVEIPLSVLITMCKAGKFEDTQYFASYGFRLKDSKYLHLVVATGNTTHNLCTIGVKDIRDADAFHMFQGLLAIAKMPLAAAKISLKILLPVQPKNTKVRHNPFVGHQLQRTYTQAQAQLYKAEENVLKAKRLAAQFGGSI